MSRRPLFWIRLASTAAAVAAIAVAAKFLPVADWLRAFQQQAATMGPAGVVAYIVVYALVCVAFGPAWILTVGAGAVWGFGIGAAVVIAGATLGATAAFLLARTILRKRVETWTRENPRFRALDRAIAAEGAKIVFLVRLSPLFPFTFVNYAFGLTGIRLVPYVVASVLGMVPVTLAYVWLGVAAAGVAGGEGGPLKRVLLVAGVVAAIGVTLVVGRLARRAIRRAEAGSPDG